MRQANPRQGHREAPQGGRVTAEAHGGSILATVSRGGKREGAGAPSTRPGEKRDQAFIVNTTAELKARFKEAGGSLWAETVLRRELESGKS